MGTGGGLSSVPHSRKTKHIDDSDLQHSWSHRLRLRKLAVWAKCYPRNEITDMYSTITHLRASLALYVYVLSRCSPLYSSTVPSVSLHCTHCTPSTVPFHRTPPLYPRYPSTLPTVPLHCTHPHRTLFRKILHNQFYTFVNQFCTFVNQFCTFVDQLFGYSGWGTVVRYKGYGGTVQVVQWYSAEGTVVQCRGHGGWIGMV